MSLYILAYASGMAKERVLILVSPGNGKLWKTPLPKKFPYSKLTDFQLRPLN